MLKVMDWVSGGVMQERWVEGMWLGSRFTTLEHLLAKKSDEVVVRTRVVRDLQMSEVDRSLATRTIVIPNANDATPCNVARLMAQVITLQIAEDACTR